MSSLRRLVGVAVLTLVFSGTFVGTAGATHVQCGTVITSNTTLHGDVGPCPSDGIIIGADNIKLDLNGYRVFGTPNPGEGAGIVIRERTGVQVRGGTVSDFDAGIAIEGGSDNKVFRMTVRDNIGRAATRTVPPTFYGDGIAILSSKNNNILQNIVVHNGPYSGIGLYEEIDADHPRNISGETSGNDINKNEVRDNNICRTPTGPCDDDGIRLEPGVNDNVVKNNVVTGSALDGIAVFRATRPENPTEGNVIQHNSVEGNGFHNVTHRKGDGIRIFADDTLVEENRVFNNAGDGIAVGFVTPRGVLRPALNNRILNNKTGGNGRGGPGYYDLHDYNPDCDNNVWRGNTYNTAFPPCTTAP